MDNIIVIKNKEYFKADDVLKNAPVFCKGCRNGRELIKKKNMKDADFTYAIESNNKWKVVDGSNKKLHKLLIQKDWIIENVDEYDDSKKEELNIAPEIIYLEDEEKFCDNDGNILEIEVRGEREYNKCYFKVKDIMKGFDMENLNDVLLDKRNAYIENKHYKIFICKNPVSNSQKTITKKEKFLTYNGLLRVLFVSKSGKADQFVNWATKTLFTAQMGTEKQKNKLIADIKGVSYEAVKESFNALATDFPCVYLITLNTVKDLRKSMDIEDKYKDDDIVCKFGLSKDFNKRMNGHAQEFKSIKNKINLSVKYYSFIDPLFISKAETEIRELLSDYSFEWNNMKEIIIINKNLFKTVKTFYENMAMKYSGHASGLNEKIKDLEVQIEKKNNEIVLLKKQHENDLLEKDRIIDAERHAKELLEKDLKIAELEKDNLERKLDVANKKIKNLKK